MDEEIKQIKQFNRFYVRKMALTSIYTDKSSYSSTEAMILHEIEHKEDCTASYLAEHYLFDKGYISRILRKLEKSGIITRTPSPEDRRVHMLEMTSKGRRDLEQLSLLASGNVKRMIEEVKDEDIQKLIDSMQTIEELLHTK